MLWGHVTSLRLAPVSFLPHPLVSGALPRCSHLSSYFSCPCPGVRHLSKEPGDVKEGVPVAEAWLNLCARLPPWVSSASHSSWDPRPQRGWGRKGRVTGVEGTINSWVRTQVLSGSGPRGSPVIPCPCCGELAPWLCLREHHSHSKSNGTNKGRQWT